MKTKKLKYVSIAIVALVLLVAVSTVLGQEPEPPGEDSVTPVAPLPEFDEEPEASVVEEDEVEEPEFILAQPPYTMNYQGYLTDGSGNPLNGTYKLVFRLYDDDTGGNLEWGKETHYNVPVTNGIFQVALGSIETLYPNDFDEALFLEVRVDGTTVTPRQPLHAVPYAFGLVPGAEVEGDPVGSNYGLTVINTGTGSSDTGIYAQGNKWGVFAVGQNNAGVYADRAGADDVYSIYSADITYSSEGYAGPDTFVWVPVQNATLKYGDLGTTHIEVRTYGEVRINADAADSMVDVEIPIQIDVPYGREYRIKNAVVYYQVDSDCRITDGWILGREFSSGTYRQIAHRDTHGTSTSYAAYTINATSFQDVTSAQAPTNVQIRIDMDNASGDVYLYGMRLQLDSTY